MVSHVCLINGLVTDQISVRDRGFQFGDGLFETLAVEAGQPVFWAAHFRRLQAGASRLHLDCPPEAQWLDDIAQCLARLEGGEATLKLVLTRGNSARGYAMQHGALVNRIVQAFAGLPPRFFSGDEKPGRPPARLCLCRQRLGRNPQLAGLKHLNRLENVLARREFAPPIDEGLMRDTQGDIIEGVMSNVFALREGVLLTPDLSQCGVAGVLRETLMRLAIEAGWPLETGRLLPEDLLQMDALFISNSLFEILPVGRIDDARFGVSFSQHEAAARLNRLLQQAKHDAAPVL